MKEILKTTSKYIDILSQNGINGIKDLLLYFPRQYEDRENLIQIKDINNTTQTISIKGKIESKKILPRGKMKIYEVCFVDINGDKGYISIFNSPYIIKKLKIGIWFIIIGKPKIQYGKTYFSHPNIIEGDQDNTNDNIDLPKIYPIYPELLGIKPSRFAKKISLIIDQIDEIFEEYLPDVLLERHNLYNIQKTIKNIHFPKTIEDKDNGLRRIFFDKLLKIQLYGLINKKKYEESSSMQLSGEINRNIIKEFTQNLNFELTNAQKRVIVEIIKDIHKSNKPMMRLLQGDVGSGKTIVATTVAYYINKVFKGQSVILAPLEVLATQHFLNLSKMLLPIGIRVGLLKGSMSQKEKNKIKQDLKDGKINILIGTHAILQEDVEFNKLIYVVIDEQHKFGVKQRSFFKKFGSPHILQMSATPIPRSMALAFFGEFKVSTIDEMPSGRKKIHTKIISKNDYNKIKNRILAKIKEGQKIFIVTPLIEESDKIQNVESAIQTYEETKEIYKEISNKVGLLHGKMTSREKNKVMNDFKSNVLSILVSTTVIEVGIDIPEATIMIIKNSERFGLSQLHQLRGRIGRSNIQSYCFLESKKNSGDGHKRLKAMELTSDGFKLAELDLEYRGAGEILGLKQSGDTDIPMDILSNIKFLETIQEAAQRIIINYPNLEGLPQIKKYIESKLGDLMT